MGGWDGTQLGGFFWKDMKSSPFAHVHSCNLTTVNVMIGERAVCRPFPQVM